MNQFVNCISVSIQLVSPTSGERKREKTQTETQDCFHSISFPNEWGGYVSVRNCGYHLFPFNQFPQRVGRKLLLAGQEIANNNESFHSISFPNEWGDCLQLKPETIFTLSMSFHSISFPNEWGGNYFSRSCPCYVSIQLVSPTSGETSRLDFLAQQRLHKLVSIQLVSPTSGECGRLS